MTTQIKLDASAMNALFPEGSEARVNLQNCVVAEFIRKNVENYLKADTRDAVNDAVKLLFADGKIEATDPDLLRDKVLKMVRINYRNSIALADDSQFKLAVEKEVKDIAIKNREELFSLIKEKAKTEFTQHSNAAEDRVHKLLAQNSKAIRDAVESYIDANLDEIMRNKLAAMMGVSNGN